MELFTKEILGTLPGAAGATWLIVWVLNTLIKPLTGKALQIVALLVGEGMFWAFMMKKPPADCADWVLAGLNGLVVGLAATGGDQLFKAAKKSGG